MINGALAYCPDIIVADDGSDDDTASLAEKTGARVIKIAENRGKGNALKILFKSAIDQGYDAVISMDADGQHDAASIPSFIDEHMRCPDNIIVGSRMGDKSTIPQARLNSMRLANFYSSLAANQFLEDTQCGFRLYPLSVIKKMNLTSERYATETEVLIKAGDSGTRIIFVNIKTIYNEYGSHFRTIRDFSLITAYVISYLTVKWIIEGVSSDRPDTYTAGNLIDRIGRNRIASTVFQIITVFTGLPITLVFLAEYLVLSPFMNNFASIRRYGCGYFKIAVATFMLPMVLVVLLADKLLNALNIHMHLLEKFIQIFYPELRTAV